MSNTKNYKETMLKWYQTKQQLQFKKIRLTI